MNINAEQIVRSVDLQKRYGQMQLRPYLTVLVGEGLWQDTARNFEVRPRVLNTGHTPAKDVHWRIAVDVVPFANSSNFRFPIPEKADDETRGGNMIAPHQDYHLAAILPYRVADADVGPLTFGPVDKGLIVWGYLSYRDGVGRRYFTTFAQHVWWELLRDRNGTITGAPMRGRFLYKHNRAN